MWIGRRPTSLAPAENPAATEDYAEAVTAACADCGLEVDDYIAAAGPFGSWLVRFERNGGRGRLVWNGKERCLLLEEPSGVEWVERGRFEPADTELGTLVAGLRTLLGPAESGSVEAAPASDAGDAGRGA